MAAPLPGRRSPSLAALIATAMAMVACAGDLRGAGGGAGGGHLAVLPDRGSVPVASAPIAVGPDLVTVLPCGDDAFSHIRAALASARRSIHLEMYELGREDLLTALENAHDRGVAVTAVVDPSVTATRGSAAVLRGHGVDIVDYPVRRGMIDHVKLLVVDSHTAIVGGINWGATSSRNHDFDVLVTGPAVTNLEAVFARDLLSSGRIASVPGPAEDPGITVATTLPGADIRPLAIGLIDGARWSLQLEQFVLTDTGVVHALERAHRRGVVVHVLLDPGQSSSDPAATSLRGDGIEVRLYPTRGELLHAKVGVADGRRVLFGSANWTTSGFHRNHEVDVRIESPAVATTFSAHMAGDWARSAGG